ncbi:MAG: hypothetical protein AAFX06_24335 [Planctomycetota bacterium]
MTTEHIRNQLLNELTKLAVGYDWRVLFIDVEVEARGKDSKYYVDSSVAVCICKVDDAWADRDLELPVKVRELIYALNTHSPEPWTTLRVRIEPDDVVQWELIDLPAKRLIGEPDETEAIIQELLVNVRNEGE